MGSIAATTRNDSLGRARARSAGAGSEIGAALVYHPNVKAVGFTGSLTAGKALMQRAAARPEPIPCFMEMSSVNPLFVLPEALHTRGAQK